MGALREVKLAFANDSLYRKPIVKEWRIYLWVGTEGLKYVII
jgi:hypothetical protein